MNTELAEERFDSSAFSFALNRQPSNRNPQLLDGCLHLCGQNLHLSAKIENTETKTTSVNLQSTSLLFLYTRLHIEYNKDG